jgi:hypothetical protein
MYDIVHGSRFALPIVLVLVVVLVLDCWGEAGPDVTDVTDAPYPPYPHVTNEKLLRFRRGWIFLLVTRIL